MANVLEAFMTSKQKKREDLLSLVRDLLVTTSIGAVASILNYIFNFVAANRLPEDSFSVFSGVIGIIYLIQVPALAIQTYFTDLLAKDKKYFEKYNLNDVIRNFNRIGLLLTLLLVCAAPILSHQMDIPLGHLILAGISVFGFIYAPVMKGILLGLKKVDLFNLFYLGESILKLVVFIVALRYSTDPSGPIIAFGLPSLLFGLLAQIYLVKGSEIKGSIKLAHQKVPLQKNYLVITVLTFLFYNSAFSLDLVMVDPNNRASYASLSLLGKIVYFASIIAISVLTSYLCKKRDRKTKNMFLYIGIALNLLISLTIVIVYIFWGDLLVGWMFDGKYSEIIPFVTPIAMGMVFYSTAYTFVNYFLSEHKVFQVVLLAACVLLQVLLYIFVNETLQDAVRNQIIVYVTMFGMMLGYWFYLNRKNIN